LLKLLLGFEKPQRGKIYYDNLDIDSLDKGELRKKLGVVLQDGGLIPGSIYENISITAPDVTRERVDEVVDGVIEAHQDGKCIMSGNGQKGTHHSDSCPSFTALENVRDVLDGGKTESDANSIYDTVKTLVEVRVLAQDKPERKEFGAFFRYSSHKESLNGRTEKRGRASCREEIIRDDHLYKCDGNAESCTG
jgi:ABC-type Fe3+/spermidine/putrescine transport system ATPase subunit